jgi:NAD(P)H-quinone oxidoreductase subunit 4
VFFGKSATLEQDHAALWMDAQPREVFIAVSMMIPIIAVGLYPKLITQTYDVKTVAVSSRLQQSVTVVAQAWTEQKTAIANSSSATVAQSPISRWFAESNSFRSAIAAPTLPR